MSDEELKTEEIKKEEVKETKNEIVTRDMMPVDDSGVLVPRNVDEAYRYAAMIVKSKLAPDHFDTAEKVVFAMQTAKELGIQPLTGMKSMYVVNGTVSLYGDLPLALVRRSGFLESISEKQFDKDGKEIHRDNNNLEAECHSATCVVKRKGEEEISRSITWKEITESGLNKNKNGEKDTYKKFRKRMMQMRVRTWALKDGFPDILLGVAIYEYDNYKNEEPKESVTDRMNRKFNLTDEKDVTNDSADELS